MRMMSNTLNSPTSHHKSLLMCLNMSCYMQLDHMNHTYCHKNIDSFNKNRRICVIIKLLSWIRYSRVLSFFNLGFFHLFTSIFPCSKMDYFTTQTIRRLTAVNIVLKMKVMSLKLHVKKFVLKIKPILNARINKIETQATLHT